MAGILRKLLGRAPDLPAQVQQALTELERLAQQRSSLAELAGELSGVIRVLYAEPAVESPPSIRTERAAEKRLAGIPLLRDETVSIDRTSFNRRWQQVCSVLAKRRPDALTLASAMQQGRLDPAWHLHEILAGRIESIHEKTEALQFDVPLTTTVWWLALFPLLAHIRAGLEPAHPFAGWSMGFCPCCGSWPRLGEFRGLEQTRWLRCLLCAAEWEFPRLCCPFCGTADHRQLGYLHVEGEENKWRATTCEECRHYLKTQSTLAALDPPELLTADLATTHLDLIAADRGYLPAM